MEQKYRQLADTIREILTGGIPLSGDVLHYLDSAMGIHTPEVLQQVLAVSDDCEAQSLCELVFFPDEMQQARIEPLLEQTRFADAEIDEMADYLVRAGIDAILVFPDDAGAARLAVTEPALRQFICRLKIDRIIDARLAGAIDNRFAGTDRRLYLRVALRNARFPFSDNAVGFLCEFLSRIAPDTPDFMDLFVFGCDTLERIGSHDDMYDALMARKRHYMEMIRQTLKSEQQLHQQPVEALMLKGISLSCTGIDEARRQISRIDRISLAVFGKTERIDRLSATEDAQPFDLGVFDKCTGGIDRIIKILS